MAELDTAAKAAADESREQWPQQRIYQLGDLRLYLTCSKALGINATKGLAALDPAAKAAAQALISEVAESGPAVITAKYPCISLLLP